ncbi:MAG: carboxypeptidase M32 [archaeon]
MTWTTFRTCEEELALLCGISNLLHWDRAVLMPAAGVEQRALQCGLMSRMYHERLTSDELKREIRTLRAKTPIQQAILERYAWKMGRAEKLPKEHVEELSTLTARAEQAWEKAKQKKDFRIFKPFLERIISLKQKEAALIDKHKHPYEVLLDEYERGMTLAELDIIFARLKRELIPLIRTYAGKKRIITSDVQAQKTITQDIATRILDTKERFLIALSAHPFTTTLGPDDIRITTAFKHDPTFAFLSTAHEAGHALYEGGFGKDLKNTILADAPSLGMHESQSRFWENIICKGMPFWHFYYDFFSKELQLSISHEQFYKRLITVQPSLIRIEADEVTYCMHIIIRYEIEKALIEGSLSVKDIPRAWNDKYKTYLGITPKHDAEGCLQDVHWSQGAFGYFPTYALGSIYAAMLYRALLREHPQLEKDISKGDFSFIKQWLAKKIHRHGAMFLAKDLMRAACGKALDVQDFITYLHRKCAP